MQALPHASGGDAMSTEREPLLTPTHHALLFAWLAEGVMRSVDEDRGARVLADAVWRYGVERGTRMAARALANGDPLDWGHYVAYGEWRAPEGEMASVTVATSPDLVRHVSSCPWSTAWRDEELSAYGRHYCATIDEALAHGFNPALRLEVASTLSGGAACCAFRFVEAHLDEASLRQMACRRTQVETDAAMPWVYHCAHLLSTMRTVILDNLGTAGERVVGDALRRFAERYGNASLEAIRACARSVFGLPS